MWAAGTKCLFRSKRAREQHPRFPLCFIIGRVIEMQKLSYRILLRPEPEGGYTVIVPSLPGCVTYGKTVREARAMAADAIQAYLASVRKHGERIIDDAETFEGTLQVSIALSPFPNATQSHQAPRREWLCIGSHFRKPYGFLQSGIASAGYCPVPSQRHPLRDPA